MAYTFPSIQRPVTGTPDFIFYFDDQLPIVDGIHDMPRQNVKLSQTERGVVNLDYGPDPGNQVITITVKIMPDFLMRFMETEYLSPNSIDATYLFKDHRGVQVKLKWKDFQAKPIRTMTKEESSSLADYYQNEYVLNTNRPTTPSMPLPDINDIDLLDIADIYEVVCQFWVRPDSLF